jgi:myo-inositol-1(or 4)-monophosphatase
MKNLIITIHNYKRKLNPKFNMFSPLTEIAIEAALAAGEILRKGFGTEYQISLKPGIQNYVTDYDLAAEKCIMDHIQTVFPTHSFLCEESGSTLLKNSEILWIIDPLDGTTNFAHHIPLFCVSIGAYDGQQILSGVIYQPITQELFVAERHKGAFLNQKKVKVSNTQVFAGGLGATGFPRNIQENPFYCVDQFIDILKRGTIVRNFGSSALNLAYVAAGKFDAYWSVSLHAWDIAAGLLLIEEAGGITTSYGGIPYEVLSNQPLVASNGIVHNELLGYLRQTR